MSEPSWNAYVRQLESERRMCAHDEDAEECELDHCAWCGAAEVVGDVDGDPFCSSDAPSVRDAINNYLAAAAGWLA